MDKLIAFKGELEKKLDQFPLCKKIEKNSGVPAIYLAGGVSFLVLISFIYGICASLVANLIGFLYPAYASFKAIESRNTSDDTQWLTYWVVFSTFSIVDYFISPFLSLTGFYFPLKVAFLLWCYIPQTQGASFIYKRFLRPFLFENEKYIDEAIKKGKKNVEKITESIGDITDGAEQFVRNQKKAN
eukprot:Sdes_comp20322_c0_seq2m13991